MMNINFYVTMCCMRWRLHQQSVQYDSAQQNISMLSYRMVVWNCECNRQGCYRYFPKVSPIFDIDTGCKSIVDTNIDTLP